MYHSPDGAIDRAGYWADASEDVIRAAAINTFGEQNKAMSNGAELRFGAHGSKSVAVRGEKRGSWYDHEQQDGGFLRIPDADFRHSGTPHSGTFILGAAKASKPRDDGNGPAARALWDASVPILGTIAEVYLAGRGILRHVPDDRVRFHPLAVNGKPCAIYAVTDVSGEVVAVQRVPLRADGSDRDRVAGKKSLGPIRDGFFALADPHPRQTLICEGPEDALATWFAIHEDISAPDCRVIAMCGQRWTAAAETFPSAIFVADADSVDKAREAAASVDGWIVDPSPHKDANALLLAEGAAALWQRVKDPQKVEAEAAPCGPKYPSFDFWAPLDFAAIARLDFIYSDFYARGYSSLTVAPPKLGKSLLGLAEAVDIATGRGFLTGVVREPQRTFYYNAEDDGDAIHSRVAALCEHYGIAQTELAGQLAVVSGVTSPDLYLVSGQDGDVNEAAFSHIEAEIERGGFDHVVFDPLQDMSRSPETNDVFRALGRRLREMATKLRVSVGIVHHTRKLAPGQDATMDDARGGGALRGTSRFNRLLVPMTEGEALQADVEDHRYFFRIGEVEANLAPPSSERNRWFRKVSVEVENGARIAAVERWQWPDAFEGITVEMAGQVYDALGELDPQARESAQSKEWAGYIVARICGFPFTDQDDTKTTKAKRSRAKQLIDEWVRNGVLERAEGKDEKRNIRPVLVPGQNNPRSVQT